MSKKEKHNPIIDLPHDSWMDADFVHIPFNFVTLSIPVEHFAEWAGEVADILLMFQSVLSGEAGSS